MDPREQMSLFSRSQRKGIINVLKRYADILAIYRTMLEKRIRAISSNGNANDPVTPSEETVVKLRDDSLHVSNLLDNLMEEIETKGRYDVLIREIADDRKKHEDEIAIVKDYEEATSELEKYEKLLEHETAANSNEMKNLRSRLIRLKNETEKVQYRVSIELKYVKSREEARREARSLRCIEELQGHKDRLEGLCVREKNEHRVAAEIVKFLEKNIAEYRSAKSQWQKRYERETLMYGSGNERLTREIENKGEALEKLQREYRERQEFIDAYVAAKEAALESRKREEHRRDCATKIQGWWRGVMVRRKLGPHRPDERKKKRPVKSKK